MVGIDECSASICLRLLQRHATSSKPHTVLAMSYPLPSLGALRQVAVAPGIIANGLVVPGTDGSGVRVIPSLSERLTPPPQPPGWGNCLAGGQMQSALKALKMGFTLKETLADFPGGD